MKYAAPWWLPGGHTQTIWPALLGRHRFAPTQYQRQRWTSPDEDFIDVDWQQAGAESSALEPKTQPLLVLFHGLEGNSQSHYAKAFAHYARQRNWAFVVPHFRGCSGELNHGPRAYHSGDHEEIAWILHRIKNMHSGPMLAVGVSMGGNALLRWAQESGEAARKVVNAVCAVCSPLDLAAAGHALNQGFSRQVYTPMFLRSMKPKALAKWQQHPGLFDRAAMLAAQTIYDFDNAFSAPLHGFKDTADYWRRASAKPHLQRIKLPALLVNPLNDPFVPAASLPAPHEVSQAVTLWRPREGGHVGFASGPLPGKLVALPQQVGAWLNGHLSR